MTYLLCISIDSTVSVGKNVQGWEKSCKAKTGRVQEETARGKILQRADGEIWHKTEKKPLKVDSLKTWLILFV